MNTSTYRIYWTYKEIFPKTIVFTALNDALNFMTDLRGNATENEYSFITMCAENTEQVGAMGVTSVENGMTPDGNEYTWNKQHRAGASRGSYSIIDNKSNK